LGSLGKTIQTLTRIIDGRPKKSDKAEGWAAGTLCVEPDKVFRLCHLLKLCYRVVCPVSLVSQWASEIQKMAVGIRVIEHHGANRTTGQSYYTYDRDILSKPALDPAKLKQAHVVVTSYSIVASEHGAFKPDAKNEGKAKSKSKKKKDASDSDDDDDDSDDSDSSGGGFGKTLAKKKKTTSKKQAKDALFRIKWWRIVLGEIACDCFVLAFG
jgi:SNF2 family DNA or RNA helicase